MAVKSFNLGELVGRRLKAARRRLTNVVEIRHELRPDSLGDLAVFLTVVMHDRADGRLYSHAELNPIRERLRAALEKDFAHWVATGWGDPPWVYVSFVLQSEQRQIDAHPGAV